MSFKIAKFTLPITGYQKVSIPAPGVPISVGVSLFDQEHEFVLYAMTEKGADEEWVGIHIVATDTPFPDGLAQYGKFVGHLTTPARSNYFVWEGPLQ